MAKQTRQIRILTDGVFDNLVKKIREQFEQKHGFTPSEDQLCESIAQAINDNGLFSK